MEAERKFLKTECFKLAFLKQYRRSRLFGLAPCGWGESFLIAGWLAIICFGLVLALDFEKRPQALSSLLSAWPSASKISRLSDSYTLLIFLHPKCPCSQASISELSRFIAKNPHVGGYLCFIVPDNVDGSWLKGANWESARKIPQLCSLADLGGREAEKFSARTSGETFLFDKNGNLLFHGGITQARGHEGDNAGLEKLALVLKRNGGLTPFAGGCEEYPVYGCLLKNRLGLKSETKSNDSNFDENFKR